MQFESYGEHLRNLLSCYWNLLEMTKKIEKCENIEDVKKNIDFINKCIDWGKNKNELLEFSKLEKLEQLNYRE